MQQLKDIYQTCTAGVHHFIVAGLVGPLEIELTIPTTEYSSLALIGHPHPLQGGTMQNKVVTTMVRAFVACNVASLRFNFRGVGSSAGSYDAGIGESEDMLWLLQQCLAVKPNLTVMFAGFSFGSYVAYRAASITPHKLLLTIAPSFHNYDYTLMIPNAWEVLHGDEDEVVPFFVIEDFIAIHPTLKLHRFAETGHFFHGKLVALKACIEKILVNYV